MEKRRLSWIWGLPVMAYLVALPYLFKPASNQETFEQFIGALKECSVAEETLEESPSEKNKIALEKAEKKLQNLDGQVAEVDYSTNFSKLERDFARMGYFIDFQGNSSQKYHPLDLGKIIEKGTFECNHFGKNKKLDYIVFNREIGDENKVSWIETTFFEQGDKWDKIDFAPINKKFIDNEAKGIYSYYRNKKSEKGESPREKLRYKICKQIFEEMGNVPKDKEKEIFIEKYFEIVKKEILYHELNHVNDISEGRAVLSSLIYALTYSTFETLYQWLELKNDDHKKAAEAIFAEYAKRGITKEKLPEKSLKELSDVAKDIFKNYKGS